MTDPILKAAANLKNELADVKSPELDAHMKEIMKLLLESVVEGNSKKS